MVFHILAGVSYYIASPPLASPQLFNNRCHHIMAPSLRSGAALLAGVPSACPLLPLGPPHSPHPSRQPSAAYGPRCSLKAAAAAAGVICKRIHFHMTSAREYAAASVRVAPVTEMINSAGGGHCGR